MEPRHVSSLKDCLILLGSQQNEINPEVEELYSSYSRGMPSESGLPCTTIYLSLTEIHPENYPANLRTGDIVLHQDPAWLLTNLELPHDANELDEKLGPPNYPHQNYPHQKQGPIKGDISCHCPLIWPY